MFKEQNMKTTRKVMIAGLLFSSLVLMSACGTVKGLGHDVSNTGHAISRAAS